MHIRNKEQAFDCTHVHRVRRIKCDETRPLCIRCTGTGRKCDGYLAQSPAAIPPGPNPIALTINGPPSQKHQNRSFEFFRTCTLPNISLHFGSPFWTQLVLQASHSEPALQHAATALGALHEHLESQSPSADHTVAQKDSGIGYSTEQYTQALIFLSALLTKSDNRSIELALIGALMCIYYEALQENFETSQVHLENCLMVLQPLLPSGSSWLIHPAENKMQIDAEIIQAFARLDIEASCTLGKRSPSLCIATVPLEIPTLFTSLIQARQLLYGLTSQLHSFMRGTADALKSSLAPIPLSTIAEASFLQLRLKEWETSFSSFLGNPSTKLSRQEQQGANVLSIQQKVTYMKAFTCLYAEEMIFDQFDQEFEEILTLAEYLIYLSIGDDGLKSESGKKVILSFDMGIIEALFWTAIKCRRSDIRHRAIDVLRRVTWQEGVWNAAMMAAIAERFVGIEEVAMDGVELRGGIDNGGRIPEWLRLHDHGWEMNLKGRKTGIRAGKRENGVDGEWTWVTESLVW